jgi:hypothetical protein
LYAVFVGVLFVTLKLVASAGCQIQRLCSLWLSTAGCRSYWGFCWQRCRFWRESAATVGCHPIWTLVLTAIGITYISKVKRKTTFAVVFGWSAVVVLARVAHYLPGYFPSQVAMVAAFTDSSITNATLGALLYFCILLFVAGGLTYRNLRAFE